MKTKVSKESANFSNKTNHENSYFSRVLYSGFGVPIDIFVNG